MRVLVAGASGVIGRRLVPRLLAAGYHVTGLTRAPERADGLRRFGAEALICDAYDADALRRAVEIARPDVIVNQLTAIPTRINPRAVGREMAATNRLRMEGTTRLMRAAAEGGVRRVVAQSIAFAYRPEGQHPATEEEPLFSDAPRAFRPIIFSVESAERLTSTVPGVEAVVLRYGFFYGPGTIYAPDGTFAADVRRRRVPLVARAAGLFSFVHIDDAADATVLGIETIRPGTYNIVDDAPATMGEWLPTYARLVRAPPPIRIPAFLARFGAGRYGMYLLAQQRGASNRSARAHLGWRPRYSTWREGFLASLGASDPGADARLASRD